MKTLYIIAITLLLSVAGLYAETDIYYRSDFDRGDVITVLIPEAVNGYTLELKNSTGKFITGNIFFPLDIGSFKGQAALIGIDSTLKAGVFTLIVKKNGLVATTGEILIHENIFKKENIPLNYANTSLRTSTNPEITSEAVFIHEIYRTTRIFSVLGNNSLSIPIKHGIFTSWYGDRRIFIYSNGDSSRAIHSGIDIAAPVGTNISAGHAGKVVFSGNRIITGNSVVIEYLPGVYGVFFHLNEYLVNEGENVEEETIIGTLGSTGLATGPHLHWEIRVGGVSINPESLLTSGLIDNSLIMSIVSSHTAE